MPYTMHKLRISARQSEDSRAQHAEYVRIRTANQPQRATRVFGNLCCHSALSRRVNYAGVDT